MSQKKGLEQPEGYRRPTKTIARLRIVAVAEAIAKGYTRTQIKATFSKEWTCSPRTVERYIIRARNMMLAESSTTNFDQLVSEAVMFWKSRMRDPKLPPREQSRARENLDKIFGLYKPTKVAVTDAQGNDVFENENEDELMLRRKRVAEAWQRLRDRQQLDAEKPSDN